MKLPIVVAISVCCAASACFAVESAVNSGAQAEIIKKKEVLLGTKFPIGFYTGRYSLATPEGASKFEGFAGANEVNSWSEMGCTVMFSPSFNSSDDKQRKIISGLLDACDERQMKMWLFDRAFYCPNLRDQSDDDYLSRAKTVAGYFGNKPAYAGLDLSDEPSEAQLVDVARAMKLQKMALPKASPFLNLGFEPPFVGKTSWSGYFDDVIQTCHPDILSYDVYVQMLDKPKVAYYFNVLKELREASIRNRVPFWTVLLAVGHMHFKCPSYDDIRWQFNTAICAGSSGLMWFFYYMGDSTCANYRLAPVDMNGDRTESWWNFKRIHKDFLGHYGDLFTRLAVKRVTHIPDLPGGGEAWTKNHNLIEVTTDIPNHPLQIGEFVDVDDNNFVMVVNQSMSQSVAVDLVFPKGSELYHFCKQVERKGKALESGGREVQEEFGVRISKNWLAPGQEVVYKIRRQ